MRDPRPVASIDTRHGRPSRRHPRLARRGSAERTPALHTWRPARADQKLVMGPGFLKATVPSPGISQPWKIEWPWSRLVTVRCLMRMGLPVGAVDEADARAPGKPREAAPGRELVTRHVEIPRHMADAQGDDAVRMPRHGSRVRERPDDAWSGTGTQCRATTAGTTPTSRTLPPAAGLRGEV